MAIIRKQKQIIKGAHLMIFVKNTISGEYEPIAFANSHTLSKTLNTKELASKDFGDAVGVLPQNYSWTMRTDNLYSLNGYKQLNDIFRQMRRVKIYFGESSYKQDGPQNSIVDKNGAVDWMTDGFGEEGFAYITSLDVTATAGENATFTAAFTGTGPLTEIESGYIKKYLTFEALEDTTFIFTQNALQYSLDNGATWTTLAANTATPTVTAGNKILWKQVGLIPATGISSGGIGTFSATGNFNASGNIMSLYYGDNFIGQTNLTGKDYAFCTLFSGCNKLINAKNLILPATTLAIYCYAGMFYNCTSLISTPELSATTLANNCYQSMFQYCTSLTSASELPATTLAEFCYYEMFSNCTSLATAPSELPATTLAQSCYAYMFYNCTSLTTTPELLATTLANNCYSNMFYNCTSLTTAPDLLAETLVTRCYQDMFNGCTSLNYIKCLATYISANNCTRNWVENVAATGTFVKDTNTTWSTGASGIPNNWAVIDA